MRTIWMLAVAVGLAGAGAGRADVVIGYAVPPAATVGVGAGGCGSPNCEACGVKECKPSLRDRLRNLFGSRSCGEVVCAAPAPVACPPARCETVKCAPAKCTPAAKCAPAACAPAKCEPAPCPRERQCSTGCGRPVGERLKAWLCYQPTKGCCNKPACGCRPAPLYAYFMDDCVQGPGCAQAPACCEKPGLWKRLCGSGHGLFGSPAGHSCGAGVGCPTGACGVR